VEISDDQIEFAVVKRLKAMIDQPPHTTYNVTQCFAMFIAVVLWIKNRAWVAGNRDNCLPNLSDPADLSAHEVRNEMRGKLITENPWCLALVTPGITLIDSKDGPANQINADFQKMKAEDFFEWLRHALAHGDGRTIRPIRKPTRTGKTLLAGFCIGVRRRKGF
jgi:hypothetical protein